MCMCVSVCVPVCVCVYAVIFDPGIYFHIQNFALFLSMFGVCVNVCDDCVPSAYLHSPTSFVSLYLCLCVYGRLMNQTYEFTHLSLHMSLLSDHIN